MAKASKKGAARYNSAHWGLAPTKTWVHDDPDLPAELIEMGKLRELRLCTDGCGSSDVAIEFTGNCVLAFTADKTERLYNVLTPSFRAKMKPMWDQDAKAYGLATIASQAGGTQQGKYPRGVKAKIVGYVTHVIYSTHKKGDGPANYIHECGEESGVLPLLAVDSKGRLWWCGGNYTCPDAGITD